MAMLPIKDENTLISLETFLIEDDNYAPAFIHELSMIGGTKPKDCEKINVQMFIEQYG